MEAGFAYAGLETCAAGNVCAGRCPVGIETGTMVLGERARRRTDKDRATAHRVAEHLGATERALDFGIGAQALSRTIIGDGATDAIAGGLRALAKTPRVSRGLRPGPGAPQARAGAGVRNNPTRSVPVSIAAPRNRVVYFPACPTRMFGAAETAYDLKPATDAMLALLERAGFDVVVPDGLAGQCCGQPFLSKGFPEEAARVGRKLVDKLAPENARVLTDASTCAKHLKAHHADAITVADSAEFLLAEVLPKLTILRKLPAVAVHQNCSAQRMNEQAAITQTCRRLRRNRRAARNRQLLRLCRRQGPVHAGAQPVGDALRQERYSSGLRYWNIDRLDLRGRIERARRHPLRLAREPPRIRVAAGCRLSPRTAPPRSVRISAPAAAARCSITARPPISR